MYAVDKTPGATPRVLATDVGQEIDHIAGYTTTRTTTLDDLAGLCGHDHDLKTLFGHTYQFDADGHVEWARPDGIVEHERPPP